MESHGEARGVAAYARMIEINHRLIRGGELGPAEAAEFFAARSSPGQARRFHAGVGFAGNADSAGRQPYISPKDGRLHFDMGVYI